MIRRHALAGAIGLVLAGAFAFAGIALHPSARHSRPPRPPVTGAYFHGGVPTYDPAVEHVIGDDLADLVVDTDGDRRGQSAAGALRTRELAALRDAAAITSRGDRLAAAWHDLLDGLDKWSNAAESPAELRKRAHAVSDQFAALGLGYYLRADVLNDHGVKHAAVFAYRVERVAFERIGNEAHRVLELRRIDHLNLTHAVLGMQADDLGDPVVLLDQIDDFIASHVVPALRGDGWPLDDPSLSAAAGDAVRRELAGRDATEIRSLVIASVRRHEARHDYDADREAPHDRAKAELSAYLSQIANDPVTPQLALWNLVSLARHRGTAEAQVAHVVLAGLSPAAPISSLARLSDDELRTRARTLWQQLYGEPYTPMVDAW